MAGAARGDHRAPATGAHSAQPGGPAKLKTPSCAARREGEEGPQGHTGPARARARQTRDGEEEACQAGTCTVAHAKRRVAGGVRARAHAGTSFFKAWNMPVQAAPTGPRTCGASHLTCTFSAGERQVEIGLSIGRPPQPSTRDTVDWWGKQSPNSLGSGSRTALILQSQIVALLNPRRGPAAAEAAAARSRSNRSLRPELVRLEHRLVSGDAFCVEISQLENRDFLLFGRLLSQSLMWYMVRAEPVGA